MLDRIFVQAVTAILAIFISFQAHGAEVYELCPREGDFEIKSHLAAQVAAFNPQPKPWESQGAAVTGGYGIDLPAYNAGDLLYDDEAVTLYRQAICTQYELVETVPTCIGLVAVLKVAADEALSRRQLWDQVYLPAQSVIAEAFGGVSRLNVMVHAVGLQLLPTLEARLLSEAPFLFGISRQDTNRHVCTSGDQTTASWVPNSEFLDYHAPVARMWVLPKGTSYPIRPSTYKKYLTDAARTEHFWEQRKKYGRTKERFDSLSFHQSIKSAENIELNTNFDNFYPMFGSKMIFEGGRSFYEHAVKHHFTLMYREQSGGPSISEQLSRLDSNNKSVRDRMPLISVYDSIRIIQRRENEILEARRYSKWAEANSINLGLRLDYLFNEATPGEIIAAFMSAAAGSVHCPSEAPTVLQVYNMTWC